MKTGWVNGAFTLFDFLGGGHTSPPSPSSWASPGCETRQVEVSQLPQEMRRKKRILLWWSVLNDTCVLYIEETWSKSRHQSFVWIDYKWDKRQCNLFILTYVCGKTNLDPLWGNWTKHPEPHSCYRITFSVNVCPWIPPLASCWQLFAKYYSKSWVTGERLRYHATI